MRLLKGMKTKKRTAMKTAPKKSPDGGRGEDTRRMILDAATKVFAMHPYNAASIRMIAAQGEFYHGLIRYHFPNKAIIFETVLEEACQNLRRANKGWLSEVSTLSPVKGLALFMDRFMDFFQNQPEVFRINIQNMPHDDLASLPGHRHLVNLAIDTQNDFEKTFKGLIPSNLARRYLNSLNILIVHYLGAGRLEAEIMGMDPESDEYLKWVKETILFIFLPAIKEMRSTIRAASDIDSP
jgi:AcrR family transcriptional regulator